MSQSTETTTLLSQSTGYVHFYYYLSQTTRNVTDYWLILLKLSNVTIYWNCHHYCLLSQTTRKISLNTVLIYWNCLLELSSLYWIQSWPTKNDTVCCLILLNLSTVNVIFYLNCHHYCLLSQTTGNVTETVYCHILLELSPLLFTVTIYWNCHCLLSQSTETVYCLNLLKLSTVKFYWNCHHYCLLS